MDGDEYLLDTETVRGFISDVREAIAAAPSPQAACDAIRPRFAELLADPDWLPERYQEGDPESGMGGGIGQWLLFRAGDRSLSLFALVVPRGSETPVHDHLAWGLVGLYRGTQDEEIFDDELDAQGAARARTRRLLRADPADRRHPPRAHDLAGDVGLDPPAHERHRLRLAPRLRPGVGREPAVPLGLRQRGLRARVDGAAARDRPRGRRARRCAGCCARSRSSSTAGARYGDAFSVTLPRLPDADGDASRDPEAIRALYTERGHGLPPGRTLSLRPIVGARSVLLLEGARAPVAPQADAAAVPRRAHARLRADRCARRRRARSTRWPDGEPFAVHPSMQAITLEVILRAVFGVDRRRAGASGCARAAGGLLGATRLAGLQFGVLLSRRFGGPTRWRSCEALRREIDAMLLAEIAERRADPTGARGHPARCSSRRASRTASRWTTREIRDQLMTLLLAGHETTATGAGVDVRPAAAPPATRSTRLRAEVDAGERRLPARRRSPSRCACARSSRSPAGGWPSELRVDGHVLPRRAPTSRRRSGSPTRAPTSTPSPTRSAPSASSTARPSTYAWIPFGGGVRRCLGAAFAEMEMRVVLDGDPAPARRCAPPPRRAERVARRNVTFSPRNGTRILAPRRT